MDIGGEIELFDTTWPKSERQIRSALETCPTSRCRKCGELPYVHRFGHYWKGPAVEGAPYRVDIAIKCERCGNAGCQSRNIYDAIRSWNEVNHPDYRPPSWWKRFFS